MFDWLFPTYQQTIKKKLKFLTKINIVDFKPVVNNKSEIKNLWERIIKKLYTEENGKEYIKVVNNSEIHILEDVYNIILKIQQNLIDGNDIGIIIYNKTKNKLYYEQPIIF